MKIYLLSRLAGEGIAKGKTMSDLTAALYGSTARPAAANMQGVKSMSMDKIDKVSKEFEANFLSQMLDHMFADLEMSSIASAFGEEESGGSTGLGDSESGAGGDDVWRSMLVEQYANRIVDAGGIGIARMVKQELLKLQEV